jgi:SAM-dependent methyltransferase
MMVAGSRVVCKSCGCQIKIIHESLMNYPSGSAKSNSLGLKQIVTCPSCDFGQTLPDPTQADLDAYYTSGQYWSGHKENKMLDAHQQVQAYIRLSAIAPLLPTGRDLRVLDIGAGSSFLGDEFAVWALRTMNTGIHYCAVEPDDQIAMRASERLRAHEIECQVVRSIDEAGDGFDLIFLNHVLEHVHDPITFLKDVKSRLSKSGQVYIEVPHRDDRFKLDVFPHVLFFSATALRQVAGRAGLTVQFCEPFGATERPNAPGILAFGARIYKALLIRLFNFAVRRNWRDVFTWADSQLYDYRFNSNGMWLRALVVSSDS